MVVILPFIYYPQILLDGDIDSYMMFSFSASFNTSKNNSFAFCDFVEISDVELTLYRSSIVCRISFGKSRSMCFKPNSCLVGS